MKAILLDRDDTLNDDPGYINDPALIRLKPLVTEGLLLLRDAGFRFFVMTNQSGIARGLITTEQLEEVNARLAGLLADAGIHIEKFYVCPHMDADLCTCRKPRPGLFQRFFEEYNCLPADCFAIGDKMRDIEAARGVPGLLLSEKKTVADEAPVPENLHYRAANMLEAAKYILKRQKGE